jgi:NADPH-dependent 2,4-dienoyl-CoA reductase/sulfur reductase-like enzyme
MKILVIGGNAAGLTAASRARRLDPRLDITVIERTGHVSYSTCGIPYFLSGELDSSDLISFTPARLLSERRIQAHTGIEVEAILPSRKQVRGTRTETGERVTFDFDRLLLATGVRAAAPPIPGCDLENVFSITTLADALRLEPLLNGFRKVSIVGGGYVGLEMADSLRRRGIEVTLFERRDRVLGSIDPDMARIVEYELERHGTRIRTGTPVEALAGADGRVGGVKARGILGVVPADAVLLDTGVVPNTSLAGPADIRLGPTGAIGVSEYMETNVPGIFAAGNCAETYCRMRHRPITHHIGTVAAKQGRIAGENLAGRRSRFRGTVGTTVLKVFDLAVGRTGLSSAEAAAERIPTVSARIEAYDRAAYYPGARKVWIRLIAARDSEKIIGAQAVGYGDVARRIDVAAAAVTSGMTLDDLAQLDLAYSPPYGSLWDPLIVAAHAVMREASG